jgi:hypothetical protein
MGDDMDLFVVVDKQDARGDTVPFTYFSVFEDDPVALGWLRVSHRSITGQQSDPRKASNCRAAVRPLLPTTKCPSPCLPIRAAGPSRA